MDEYGAILSPGLRSRIYLHRLCRVSVPPARVVLLQGDESYTADDALHEKVSGIPYLDGLDLKSSLAQILDRHGIEVTEVDSDDINSDPVHDAVAAIPVRYWVYSGKGGQILGERLLNTGKMFLHAHPGKVPQYRGSTTLYYSILSEHACHVSVFFMDKQIDTGPLISIQEFPLPENKEEIDLFYDPYVRSEAMASALENFLSSGTFDLEQQLTDGGETYFIIHPVLKHLAILQEE